MQRATLEIEFLTPAFLGGAEQGLAAEWRAASVRGQLRWWFRAVAGGAWGGDLRRVREAEAHLFGSTDRASNLVVRAEGKPGRPPSEIQQWGRAVGHESLAELWGCDRHHPDRASTLERLQLNFPTNPLLYLGYGCLEYVRGRGVKLGRPCLAPGEKARLRLSWRSGPAGADPDGEARSIWELAVWAWLHLGGIGSRSRRGYGSLRAVGGEGVPQTWISDDRAAFTAGAQRLFARAASAPGNGGDPAWSHLSPKTTVWIETGTGQTTWDEAMVRAGAWMMAFRRRYGSPADQRRGSPWPLAGRDYVWAKQAARRETPGGLPDRAGFGLPLPFGKKAEQIVSWGGRGADQRRASPLLIHIARFGDRYFPVLTHLPAQMLPRTGNAGTGVEGPVRFKGLDRPQSAPTREHRSIVDFFLEDLEAKRLVERIVP